MLSDREVKRSRWWGGLPTGLRRHYIAQRGLCPYCGTTIIARQLVNAGDRSTIKIGIPSVDHVIPKSRGGRLDVWNKVICCSHCNNVKQNRNPRPCELLFAFVTAEIFFAHLPRAQHTLYNGERSKPKRIKHSYEPTVPF